MMNDNINELDTLDEDFLSNDTTIFRDIQLSQDKLSNRRQIEELLERKRLREELADF